MAESRSASHRIVWAAFSLSALLLLSFIVDVGLNSLIAIMHELGHYLVGILAGSAKLTLVVQTDTFPPIFWVTGRVTHSGDLGPARAVFYLAPALTTLPPAMIAAWLSRRSTYSTELTALRNGLLSAWFLMALFTLFPSLNPSTGSDGAMILGMAGLVFGLNNPVSILFASYQGWAVFRLAWWITAVYVTARIFFARAQLSFVLLFSLVSFAVIGLILNWHWLP